MNAIARIGLADWQARTRSFAFIVITAIALQLAYLLIPDRHAGYVTVSIGGYRGIYNAEWMGAICAILTATLLTFAGFYVIRGAVTRDERFGCMGIVAASPVRRTTFVLGKWLSNTAVLFFISLVLLLGAMVMQQVRAENRAFDFGAFVLPFLFVVLPICTIVAAAAVVFDVVRPLRGVLGSALWFFVATGIIAAPLSYGIDRGQTNVVDPLGMVPLFHSMIAAVHAAAPLAHANDVSIGGDTVTGVQPLIVWHGMTWTFGYIASRFAWVAAAAALVMLAAVFFDRSSSQRGPAKHGLTFRVGAFIPNIPGLRLFAAELSIVAGASNGWWMVGAAGLGVLGAVVPQTVLVNAIFPLALLFPLGRYALLGTRDATDGTESLVMSAPHAVTRSLVARVAAAGLLGCLPLAGTFVHAPALIVVPFAAAALAIPFGRLAGTPRAFEAWYLAVWYLGALNHAPIFDVPQDAMTQPVATLAVGTLALAAASVLARLQFRTR